MKKLQQANVELNPNEYFKENKDGFKYQKRVGMNHYKNTENIEENLNNEDYQEGFDTYNEKEYHDDAYQGRYESGYNKKKKFSKYNNDEHRENQFWEIATNNNFNSGENDYYNDYEQPIQKEEKRSSIKPKKIIKREKEPKPVEEPKKQEDNKDKVVFAVQV